MTKNILNTFWGLMVIFLATASWAIAEDQEAKEKKETVHLGEMVVTATRTEKEASSAPASVSVVTQEDIKKRGSRSVDEALRGLAGAYGGRRTKGGVLDSLSGSATTLRGIPSANNTLFMVDGIVLNDAYSGSHRSTLSISPESIKRIEVAKGPFSSLYGGYAVGGVVNIMTRMPEEREFTLKTGYGSSWDRCEGLDDLKTFYFSGGDKFNDKASFLVSYAYKGTNGYPTDLNLQSRQPTADITGWTETTSNKGATRYLIGDTGDKHWEDNNLSLKAGYDFTDKTKLNLSFTDYRYDYDYDEPHTYLKDASGEPVWSYGTVREASFLGSSRQSHNEERLYGLNFETELSQVKIKTSLGYVDRSDYYYISPSRTSATRSGGPGVITSSPCSSYNADLQLTVPLWDRHVVTFGGAFKHGEASSRKNNLANWRDADSKTDMTFEARGEDRTWSLFAQDEIIILDNLTAYLGFRHDWWETYDGYTNYVGAAGYPKDYPTRSASAFSPKAALVYQLFDMTTLHSSVGKSFRPPSVYELYSVSITGTPAKTTQAGPDLEPEKTTSWDFGFEQGLWKGAKIGATYFENHMEDLIYSQTITETLVQKVNIGKAESKGVELEIEQRFDDTIRLFANFTYTDSEVTENEAKLDIVGKKLTQVPEKMFNIGGDYTHGPFAASLIGSYVSKRYSSDDNSDEMNNVYGSYDSYFVADVRIGYKVTDFAEVSFSVDNIFDEDYYAYYVAPGRSWFAELTLTF